jgi:putative ABC transport system permease protein
LFTTDRRIKEIGLRKVAGSTSGGIILMLNLEFVRWIVISFFQLYAL